MRFYAKSIVTMQKNSQGKVTENDRFGLRNAANLEEFKIQNRVSEIDRVNASSFKKIRFKENTVHRHIHL
jgi:hypothetical protein